MHAVALVPACLLLLAPITTTTWWASGTFLVTDPAAACRRGKRARAGLSPAAAGSAGGVCHPALLAHATAGVRLAQDECEHQFRHRRWNCTAARRSIRRVVARDTRETGFVHALVAAGVAYQVTRACTKGEPVGCSCDRHHQGGGAGVAGGGAQKGRRRAARGRGRVAAASAASAVAAAPAASDKGGDKAKDFEWDGCGENIEFGIRKSKEYLDKRYRRRSDIKTLVKLHNYVAGRLAIKNNMRTECKCHGLSGSCTLRTCTRKMPNFREVGNRLKERFDGAAKVIAGNDGQSFMPEGETIKPPGNADLVYTEESPDFCLPNSTLGSFGTQGRACSEDSPEEKGCAIMCCGRGHQTVEREVQDSCHCKFIYCCEVKCKVCNVTTRISTCL